jgi:hypothetical protein
VRKELETQLIDKYPKIFVRNEGNRLEPYAMFGIECGDGWYDLLNHLCSQIQHHTDWSNEQRNRLLEDNPYKLDIPNEVAQVRVSQVKEKFGTLRFYYSGGDDRIDGMVRMAESMSSVICEVCGDRAQLRGRGWWYTACNRHTRPEDLVTEQEEVNEPGP